jgi:mannose-6-phosphate isomerase-like protein (cupin superfamily)
LVAVSVNVIFSVRSERPPSFGPLASTNGKPHLKQSPRRVEKPWGYELLWADTSEYVGKLLHIQAGEALSLQYHEQKDETIHLLSGRMSFSAGRSEADLEDIDLRAGESFHVSTGTVHRMVAITDCDVLEASTPHLDDVVRLEDRYGRVPADG